MATRYQFVDDSGETRLAGTLAPDPGTFLVATVRLSEADLTTLGTVPVLVAAGVRGSVIIYTTPVLVQGAGGSFNVTDNDGLRLRLGDGSGWAGSVFSHTLLGDAGQAIIGDFDAWQNDHELLATLEGQPMYLYASAATTVDPGASAVLTVAYFLAPAT